VLHIQDKLFLMGFTKVGADVSTIVPPKPPTTPPREPAEVPNLYWSSLNALKSAEGKYPVGWDPAVKGRLSPDPGETKQMNMPYGLSYLEGEPYFKSRGLDWRTMPQADFEAMAWEAAVDRYNKGLTWARTISTDPHVAHALATLHYTHGKRKALGYEETLKHIEAKRYSEAAREVLISSAPKHRLNLISSLLRQAAGEDLGSFYDVRPGDSLSRIAKQLGVSVQHLMAKNNITDPNKISAGARLFY